MNQGHQDIDAKAGAQQTSEQQLICLNQNLLESVVSGDWLTYSSHCSEDLTCFEAETNGVLAEGRAFHQFYFDLPAAAPSGPPAPIQVSMARPHIRWISADAAVLSYTRLTQKLVDGAAVTASCCETRIWQRIDGTWKHVHVHRS
jgi:calcium/calmodulin-dependent protein kinase (CaM kinase) II